MANMLPLALLLFCSSVQATVTEQQGSDEAKTYQLKSIAVVRSKPEGSIVDIWNGNTLFTSNQVQGDWVKVTGHFPDGNRWQPSSQSAWINRHYISTVKRQAPPRPSNRPNGAIRYIEINKSNFELRVVEQRDDEKKVLLKTTVAVGMDRCLPKEKGGKCYYTDPGEYQVRWKVHDPEGIEWCIPKSMEKEYASSISRGKRCFRGSIGKHALNIGKTYAIHGTSNPNSLGKKVSHGCVRTANNKIARIYDMMDVGDKVYIVE
ncbi:MAG: L,D-transpeptidase [Pseudomonadota bacterium]